ncbi:MAG: NAD(P)-dependent alcohol dehydrogenase [Myxococcota bacterium]
MKAAYTHSYGPADVVELRDIPVPTVGEHDVLVQVHAAAVTEGDRRLRAGDFPGISAIPGRLAMGFTGPRNAYQGTMFAGRVVQVGAAVRRYAIGDDVFGGADHSAYAEFLCVHEDSSMAKMPANVTYAEAASIPYGAGTAVHFLCEVANVQPGQRVLVLGASGGVGRFAVQLAKHLGAEVTGVCSHRGMDRVRQLGADHVIDYGTTDFTKIGHRYDVIFDIAGASSFGHSRSSLAADGVYMTVYMSLGVLVRMAWTSVFGRKKAKMSIAFGERQRSEKVRDLVRDGVLTACLGPQFPFERITEAHLAVENVREHGTVVMTMLDPVALREVV